jgi:unsaturated chondroitin disaccharide hydrolase
MQLKKDTAIPIHRAPMEPLARAELFATPPEVDLFFWKRALGFAVDKIRSNVPTFAHAYPPPTSTGNVYPPIANTEWTSSFWTGLLWLAYENSGDELFRETAAGQLADYRERLDGRRATDTHDLGFLYSLSCVAAWKLTGDRASRATALKAADLLMVRYFEKAGVIQAWGNLNDPEQRGRIIIDCAMNLPLLHWASAETSNPYYAEAAARHIERANAYAIRSDWSSYHTYYFDTESGAPLRGVTAQGYADDSCWARGQAWGIYGNPLSARYLRDPTLLENARGLARYFLNRLPDDLVAYWDLVFTSGNEERDSSAAAIAACGLLELAAQLPVADPDRRPFENAALRILASLAENYTSERDAKSNGILLHSVYNKPKREGVDECSIWGDYFYVEALTRVLRSWKPYW